ncbi:ABC transporter permease [candidate division KSB1 bacterium]|nr:ABC transporter permease [candidate division KSB1 bacterium]
MMFMHLLKIAVRNFKRYPGYSLINLFGLAVGMAVCIAIFLWVQDEWRYDRFHTRADRLHRVVSKLESGWTTTSPWAISEVLKKDYPEVIRASRYRQNQTAFRYRDIQFQESYALVDRDFFDMFSFPLLKGNPDNVFEMTNAAVLTQSAATRFFGDEDPMGKVISIENQQEVTVTGLMQDVPANSSLDFSILINMKMVPQEVLESWALETGAYVLLSENVALDEFRKKMSGTTMKYDKRTNQQVINDLQPLTRIHLYSYYGTSLIFYVYMFSAVAVFILLLACINFINLSTARAGKRAREIGMRKVTGAARGSIMRQFLLESMAYAVVALLIALGLVRLFLPEFNALSGKHLALDLLNNAGLMLGLLAIALFTGILSGGYPAWVLSSFKPVRILKQAGATSSSRSTLRKCLVVLQFVVAISLTIGTFIVYRQLSYIRNKDLGFNRNQIVVMRMNQDIRTNYQTFKDELKQHTHVIQVTAANNLPTQVGNINPVYWEGRGPEEYEIMNFVATDHDYIETFDMQIVQGRNFSRDYQTDVDNYIVNEEAVKFMQLQEPVGKLFSIWQYEGRIIGVVGNFHATSLRNQIKPVVITLHQNWWPSQLFIRIKPDEIPQTLERIETLWKRYTNGQPFIYNFLDDIFDQQYRAEQRLGRLFNYFAVLTIFISCLGLLGLASFMAEQRTKEVGVRKVLGATYSNIILLLSREFGVLIAVANLIAWPLTFILMKRWLNNFAYHAGVPLQVFVFSALLVLAVAMVSVSFQAVRAARADAVRSLRYE